jgi:hypothetical protein
MALDNITSWFAGGFERCQAGTIDGDGYFTGDDGSPASLTGTGMLQLEGANVATVPAPAARSITPEGDDGKVGTIMLASIDTIQFELGLKVHNATFSALVQGTTNYAEEEWTFTHFDPDTPTFRTMCLVFSRKAQSKVAASPGQGYEHLILPNCQISFNGVGQLQTGVNEATYNYSVTVDRSTKTPWGRAFSLTNDGTVAVSGLTFFTEHRWTMHAFTGDNSDVSVVVNYTPISSTLNTKNLVYVNGTKETTGVTISSKTFTWGSAPASAAKVVIAYEHSQS